MRRATILILLLIVALIAVSAWRLTRGDHEHERFQAELWRARHLDATFNQDLLRARFGLQESYDDFERYLREMDSIAASLHQAPQFVSDPGRAEIVRAANELEELLRERRLLFEQFKSSNAVLANSNHYFPEGVSELALRLDEDPADRELDHIIQGLTAALLPGASSADDLRTESARRVDEIREWAVRNPSHPESAFVAVLARHAQELVSGKSRLDALTRQLLALPTAAGIEGLSRMYELELAVALHRAQQNRTLLYVLAGLLLSVVALALRAQRRANQTLERRVVERTRALEAEIGERRRSEEALRRSQEETARERARLAFIFDAVPVGFAWMRHGDLSSRIVNAAHIRITGVDAEHSRSLAGYRDATHCDDRTRQDALQAQLRAGAINQYEIEKRYVHADGAVRWATLTKRLHRDPATGECQEVNTVIDITDRKRAEASLAETHRQLLDTSRQAGMAEVATGVLHNVGNVLNSVNVSATIVADQVRGSKVDGVGRLAALLAENAEDLAGYFTRDPRGRQVPGYLRTLSEHLAAEQTQVAKEVDALRKNIEHIRDIVSMQQGYAKVSGVREQVVLTELVEDALRLNADGLARHEVMLVRDFEAEPTLAVEKHKVLQILVNLIRNAKHACDESSRNDKRIIVRVSQGAALASIAVIDNGVGIPPENLTRIFGHGFTTRRNGHGFGLHSGALAAREIGGRLTVQSEGPGCGATFILELSLSREAPATGGDFPKSALCDLTVTPLADAAAILLPA